MGASKHIGPRIGSRAYLALQYLNQAGLLDTKDWMIHAAASKAYSKFAREVSEPLMRFRLVEISGGGVYRITKEGREFLGARKNRQSVDQPVTPGRYVAPIQPLSPKNRPGVRSIRPGAFDYRDVPSVFAGKAVAYSSSITKQREDVTA